MRAPAWRLAAALHALLIARMRPHMVTPHEGGQQLRWREETVDKALCLTFTHNALVYAGGGLDCNLGVCSHIDFMEEAEQTTGGFATRPVWDQNHPWILVRRRNSSACKCTTIAAFKQQLCKRLLGRGLAPDIRSEIVIS